MRNTILAVVAAGALVAVAVSATLVGYRQTVDVECLGRLNECRSECKDTRDSAINATLGRLMSISFSLAAATIECVREETAECRGRIEELEQEQERLLNIQSAAEAQYAVCKSECRSTWNCYIPQGYKNEFEIDCLGPTCFREVLEVCTVVSGPCGDCWRSLCGGGEWTFESEVPLSVTLVAATDPLKNPRVIATSSLRGKQAVLSVPSDIKLGGREQLYLRFDSQEKPGGPVKVLIHRNR